MTEGSLTRARRCGGKSQAQNGQVIAEGGLYAEPFTRQAAAYLGAGEARQENLAAT